MLALLLFDQLVIRRAQRALLVAPLAAPRASRRMRLWVAPRQTRAVALLATTPTLRQPLALVHRA